MQSQSHYYELTVQHRNSHKCGGLPYANGTFLSRLPVALSANKILEIGTSIGYSAYCFASSTPKVHITTIDMKAEHEELAINYWTEFGVGKQIQMIIGRALDILPMLKEKYDIIFFDGFAPDSEEAKYYQDLVSDKGIIVTTNISWNKTTPEYFNQLENHGLETKQYYDTAISSRNSQSLLLACDVWEEAIANEKVSS